MDSHDPLTKPAVVWSKTQRRQSLGCIWARNSSRKSTEEQSDTVSIDAQELGLHWSKHEQQEAFPGLIYQGTARLVGTRSFIFIHFHLVPFDSELTALIHRWDSLRETSVNCHGNYLLPWSRDTPQHLRFLNWEILPWPRWGDLYPWQILSELLTSSSINNDVTLPSYVFGINYYKCRVGNSMGHKPLPKSETETGPSCTLAPSGV